MTTESRNIEYCTANEDRHLEGICLLTRDYLGFYKPTAVKLLFKDTPDGIKVAVVGDKVIGMCVLTILDDNEAFIALMAVDSGYRRRGVATRLFRACEGVAAGRNISLYSDPDAVQFYQSVGFKYGHSPSIVYFATFKPKRDILEETIDSNIKIVAMPTVPFEDLLKYDKTIAIVDREFWLRFRYDDSENSCVALDENGKICGYGCHFPLNEQTGVQLQPIHAENPQIAKLIVQYLLRKVPEGSNVTVKVPKENEDAIALMKSIGFPQDVSKCEFVVPVMHTQQQVPVVVKKLYSTLNGMNQPA